jgi:hypothetical protein
MFMRILAILTAVAVAGCLRQEMPPQSAVKKQIVYRERIVVQERIVYVPSCPEEPLGGCNAVKVQASCAEHRRCQWVGQHGRATGKIVEGYCRKIHCQ